MSVSFRPLLTPEMIAEEVVGEDVETENRDGDPRIIQIGECCQVSLTSLQFRVHKKQVTV